MTIVLSESTDAQQPVQRSGPFIAIDGAKFEQSERKFAITALSIPVDETVHWAVHGLRVIGAVVHLHRWIHSIFIEMQMTRSFEQLGVRNMWRENKLVSACLMSMSAVVLHQLANNCTFGMPNCQPAAKLLRKRKQIHLNSKFAMVALLCFGKACDVFFKSRLRLPCGAVDTLQHRAFFVATPICTGNLHKCKVS